MITKIILFIFLLDLPSHIQKNSHKSASFSQKLNSTQSLSQTQILKAEMPPKVEYLSNQRISKEDELRSYENVVQLKLRVRVEINIAVTIMENFIGTQNLITIDRIAPLDITNWLFLFDLNYDCSVLYGKTAGENLDQFWLLNPNQKEIPVTLHIRDLHINSSTEDVKNILRKFGIKPNYIKSIERNKIVTSAAERKHIELNSVHVTVIHKQTQGTSRKLETLFDLDAIDNYHSERGEDFQIHHVGSQPRCSYKKCRQKGHIKRDCPIIQNEKATKQLTTIQTETKSPEAKKKRENNEKEKTREDTRREDFELKKNHTFQLPSKQGYTVFKQLTTSN